MFISCIADFTPSRGNTPIHHAFGTPGVNKASSQNRTSPSPSESSPDKKKKLLELFKDSVKDNQDDGVKEKKQAKPTIQDVLPKSSNSTPYRSGANSACSSERITSEDRASVREPKSSLFCIPSLTSCRSFRERRRKTSPAIAVDGKLWVLLQRVEAMFVWFFPLKSKDSKVVEINMIVYINIPM